MEPTRPLRIALLGAAWIAGCQHVPPAPIDPEARAAAFASRSLDSPALRSLLETERGAPFRAWPPPRWDPDALATAALSWQPSLAAARARADGATAAIRTAGARPNPTLGLIPERGSNPGSGVPPWIAAIQLDWPIETAGKRERRIEKARAEESSAELATRAEEWAVRQRVQTAVLDVVASEWRRDTFEREVETARALADLLAARVAAGAATAGDAAPLRMTLLDAEQALAGERARAAELRAVLAQAVGLSVRAIESVALAAEPASDPAIEALSRDAALRLALTGRADVLAALADYAAAEASLRLELAKQWPDLHIGSGYQFDQGQSKWSVGLSLELPVLDRNEGPIAQAVAARVAASVAFDAMQASVVAAVERAIARRDGVAGERARLDTLFIEREREVDRRREALRLGASDAVAVRTAELEWLRARRARDDAAIAWRQALVDLEAAVQPASSGGMP